MTDHIATIEMTKRGELHELYGNPVNVKRILNSRKNIEGARNQARLIEYNEKKEKLKKEK